MSRRTLLDPPPVTLDVVPSELRDRDEDERRALECAAGRDPRVSVDAGCVALMAAVLLVAFVVAAAVR